MRYIIEGENLPVLICYLSQGERMFTEKGGMSWMTPNMEMQTQMEGGIGKAIGRSFSGEAMFMNSYVCTQGEGMVAFGSSFPGKIIPLEISPQNTIIAQKNAYLASEPGVELSVHFTRKVGAGFFGGEGFILQKLSGQGLAFLEIDGHVVEYDLQPGQSLIVDTGHLAAMTESVQMDVQTVKGMKNKFLGGEGFFNTKLTGPGHVWLQSMPFNRISTGTV